MPFFREITKHSFLRFTFWKALEKERLLETRAGPTLLELSHCRPLELAERQ
jgi:hypothetical protein